MKVLVGSLGDLGYLVKPLPAGDPPAWMRFEDESALLTHLRREKFTEVQIRSVLRSIRADGRAILSMPDSAPEPPAPPHRGGRPHRIAGLA